MGDWKKSEAQLRKTINDMNVVTGANDTNIVAGVDRLIKGYGQSSEPKLQNKVITENGTYQADNGYDGLGSVTIEVTSSGRSGMNVNANFAKVVMGLKVTEDSPTIYPIIYANVENITLL